MSTIKDFLPWVESQKGLIGFEIEVEGRHLPNIENSSQSFLSAWRITTDGSLRGEAWEYVFKRPYSFEGAETALSLLKKEYEYKKSIIYSSIRAGIHVHLNVQDLSLKEFTTLLAIYYSLEEVLVNFCGEDRIGNHFCLRASDAEYVLAALVRSFYKGKVHELTTDNIRYSALNLSALFKYGSLEFRTLRSTKDIDRILMWIKAIISLKNAAQGLYNSPQQVLESLSLGGAIFFAKNVLGEELFKHFDVAGLEEKIYKGARNIQDFAYLTDITAIREFDMQRDLDTMEVPVGFGAINKTRIRRVDVNAEYEIPIDVEDKIAPQVPQYKELGVKPIKKDNPFFIDPLPPAMVVFDDFDGREERLPGEEEENE